MQKLAWNILVIVNTKGYIGPSLSNSGTRYHSRYKKSLNWDIKRACSTKIFAEHQIHEYTIVCPELIINNTLIKYKTKIKEELKEEVKDEKKVYLNPKSNKK